MHTNNTHEKAHGCDPVGFQNDTTNDLDFPTGQREGKAFATLAARFALAGHTLTRSNPADGAVMYYACRWGLSRAMPDLETAAQFLARLGGGI
jgi:hypothetical protein